MKCSANMEVRGVLGIKKPNDKNHSRNTILGNRGNGQRRGGRTVKKKKKTKGGGGKRKKIFPIDKSRAG